MQIHKRWILLVLLPATLLIALWAGCGMVWMPGKSHTGKLQALSPEETTVKDGLIRHSKMLSETIGERHIGRPEALDQARQYLRTTLIDLGYEVAAQEYNCRGVTVANLHTKILGVDKPKEIVVVGAHYDSVPDCAGANDNGSGVVALLEIARLLRAKKPSRTIYLVAFVNEEPPYFQTEEMGSLVFAKECAERGDNIVAMLSLETMGYYSDQPGSQGYPFPLSLVYPDKGNFIGFVGDYGSRELVHKSVESFRQHAAFPSEGAALPSSIKAVGWSDQWSFWQQGYQGVMVTDTAPFRYPHYHEREDTIDKMDFDRLARVVVGLSKVIYDL